MYTIVMNNDKSLVTTLKATLFQRETCVDKIQFLFPANYEDFDLSDKDNMIVLKYIDQGNVSHAEILAKDDELYKGYARCVLPVDTKLTQFAGDIRVHFSFLKLNSDNGIHEEVFHSGETTITIQALTDLFAFAPNESLEVLDKGLLQLKAAMKAASTLAESIDQNKADDIQLDLDEKSLYLTSNGEQVGNAITLNDLGDALAENTKEGLTYVIVDQDEEPEPVYTLEVNSDKNEVNILADGQIINTYSVEALKDLMEKQT